jgi:MerR family copper efflux transcriptional regulator
MVYAAIMDGCRSVYTIGQIARTVGVGVETIRFYERQGLLPEPPRKPSGYRQYSAASLERLRFIRRAKSLGFSLVEVRELLDLHPDSARACEDVAARVQCKLDEIAARMRDLEALRGALSSLAGACEARAPLEGCPLLKTLGQAGAGS